MSTFPWSMGETYAVVGIVMFMGGGTALSWLVGRFSERWANRIAGFALLCTVASIILALLMWTEPWPR